VVVHCTPRCVPARYSHKTPERIHIDWRGSVPPKIECG